MKKTKLLIGILLLLIFTSCAHHSLHINDISDSNSKYQFYRGVMKKCLMSNWSVPEGQIYKGATTHTGIYSFDAMYYQGFYGIYLGLNYHTTEKNLDPIRKWIDSLDYMLKQTGGVYLRNCTDNCINEWKGGRFELEASKDQIVGLSAAMVTMYALVEDKDIKNRLRRHADKLHTLLESNAYSMWSYKHHRPYKSDHSVWKCYSGVNTAMRYIRGHKSGCGKNLTPLENSHLDFDLWVYRNKRDMWLKKLKIGDHLIQDWPILKDQKWWQKEVVGNTYSRLEFGLNLMVFDMYICSLVDKKAAEKINNVLAEDSCKQLRHLFGAAVYVMNLNRYSLKDKNGAKAYYTALLKRDDYWYPSNITPNSEGIVAKTHIWHTTTQGQPINYHNGPYTNILPEGWATDRTCTTSQKDLVKASATKKIGIDVGLPYLVRYLMVRTRNK